MENRVAPPAQAVINPASLVHLAVIEMQIQKHCSKPAEATRQFEKIADVALPETVLSCYNTSFRATGLP